ncbi:ribonuclease H2 subunit C [Phlebotomus argentipes]|uniref:ribonuclease H2 subunit C n=1 Tax=Phlebotomus argentipes TaxID=94469 RepID=UPI0028929A15|nr:ribonuclease H2 subunit C [Phlebotomus argentipes]
MTTKSRKITTDGHHSAPTAKVHFLPADTDTSGAANVEKHFEKFEKTDANGVVRNSLRGYPLVGENFTVPSTHQGIVLTTATSDSATMEISKHFSEFSYWNYDTLPSRNDSLRQAMDWLDISRALHGEEDSV